ncbi:7311_t:CDS:2 [Paraglomus occultum]|uniref:rhomboid protease n=1 Tax=Paraglomus occultum TaxID=144539 RepID=A0A9N9BRT3_9GLOM|nr:7311_t:CDS:2 [Paraglomus occultum]
MASQVQTNISSFSAVTSSFKSYIKSLPLLTTAIAVEAILVYVLEAIQIFGEDKVFKTLGLLPKKFFKGSVYRLVSYPLPHLTLGHLLFNLLVFIPLSSTIEHTLGTLEYLYVLFNIFTLLSGSIYLALSSLFDFTEDVILGGLSAWVFGVVVWESRELAGRERDICGFFRVPAHFYPLVLLLLMEILFQHSWFLAHLCGLFAGFLYSFGYLSRVLPSSSFFSRLESRVPFSWMAKCGNFVKASEGSRGGWWLPLWNDDTLEDAIDVAGEDLEEQPHPTNSQPLQTQKAARKPTQITTPVFAVASSVSSSESTSPTVAGSEVISAIMNTNENKSGSFHIELGGSSHQEEQVKDANENGSGTLSGDVST